MALDWGTLFGDMIDAIGDVLTSFVTALSDNADTIAELLIFGTLIGAAVKLGNGLFSGLTGALKDVFS